MDAQPKLLDRVREKIRAKHYSLRTEHAYLAWIRRFILFNDKKHPAEMSAPEVERFLTHLAIEGRVAAATQNQALAAILFLYRDVLEVELPWIENVVRARMPVRMPVVLPRADVQRLLDHLEGELHLVAQLLYGSGLRLMEALRLRLKDIDFEYSQIVVRDGKNAKDRVTILPDALVPKYPNAPTDFGWQYVFPAARPTKDPRTGLTHRHRLHETSVQRAVRHPLGAPASRNPSARTRCATASPRICSSAATTSAPCKSSWVTRTSARRRSTRT